MPRWCFLAMLEAGRKTENRYMDTVLCLNAWLYIVPSTTNAFEKQVLRFPHTFVIQDTGSSRTPGHEQRRESKQQGVRMLSQKCALRAQISFEN